MIFSFFIFSNFAHALECPGLEGETDKEWAMTELELCLMRSLREMPESYHIEQSSVLTDSDIQKAIDDYTNEQLEDYDTQDWFTLEPELKKQCKKKLEALNNFRLHNGFGASVKITQIQENRKIYYSLDGDPKKYLEYLESKYSGPELVKLVREFAFPDNPFHQHFTRKKIPYEQATKLVLSNDPSPEDLGQILEALKVDGEYLLKDEEGKRFLDLVVKNSHRFSDAVFPFESQPLFCKKLEKVFNRLPSGIDKAKTDYLLRYGSLDKYSSPIEDYEYNSTTSFFVKKIIQEQLPFYEKINLDLDVECPGGFSLKSVLLEAYENGLFDPFKDLSDKVLVDLGFKEPDCETSIKIAEAAANPKVNNELCEIANVADVLKTQLEKDNKVISEHKFPWVTTFDNSVVKGNCNIQILDTIVFNQGEPKYRKVKTLLNGKPTAISYEEDLMKVQKETIDQLKNPEK